MAEYDKGKLINTMLKELSNRQPDIQEATDFFEGKQKLKFASKEWRKTHGDRYQHFADNWCGVVASAPAERLKVTGFRLNVDKPMDPVSSEEKLLMDDWRRNEMGMQSSQGFLKSIIAKRSHVFVWADEDDNPIQTWDDPSQSIVAYDPQTRSRIGGLKCWEDENGDKHVDAYFPDEVIKLGPKKRKDTTSETLAGMAVIKTLNNPLGEVPIVEVPNRPMLGGEPLSDIQGTMAMQNAINLLWAYLFGAADFASMPARVVLGQEPPKIPKLDAEGNKIGDELVDIEALKEGRMLWLSGQDTSIAQWEAAKLDVFTDAINVAVRHIAAQSRTPIHYIVGELNNVNGETLLAGETGLVKKCEEFDLYASPAIREVHRLSAKVRGLGGLSEACRTGKVLWADPQIRTQAQASDAALKDKQVGFSFEWIAEHRYGLTPEEIQRELGRRRQEASLMFGDVPDLSVKQDDDGLAASGALEG